MRSYSYGGRAGCVSLRKSRSHQVMVGIYHADQAGLCADGGPWVTVCEKHGSLCNHPSLMLAQAHAPHLSWCEECSESE